MQSALYAVGSGFFLAGNAVFFTTIVGLSAAQVGLGLSIAGALGFFAAVPLGTIADRVGPLRAWILAALVEGCVYLTYPLARGFAAFVVIVTALALAESAGNSARGAYTLDAFGPAERVRVMAYNRSALNLGFTVGALLGGVALASGNRTVTLIVPVLAGLLMLLTALLVSRLPASRRERGGEQRSRYAVLRDRPFLLVSLLNGVLGSHQVLLMIVFPLWLVERTDAPRAVLAWLLALNTVLAVGLQVWAARGADTVRGSVRSSRVAAGAIAAACLVIPISSVTEAWVTITLLAAAYVALTFGELFQSAGYWGLVSELSPVDQRPQYQGAFRLGLQLQSIVGPAAFTLLAVTWSPLGWLPLAALIVLAAAALGPAAVAAVPPKASRVD
ncbi:MFS transporter [Kribbella amoyensis]|uniref:MFS transporter n=1 Tax=Kribbella amoyensis TaxID=996641 RepID=UPI001478865F|nr:MFS transporter [Kribbella amoyensis]